ncbi:MAG: hypothetical protein EBS19_15870, partial [Spirochaetia bacterium]|nr:hypothetical protein [Spirochaetia bacterium]
DVDESNAGNKEMIRRCTHLFRNEHNQQVLFAIALSTQTAGAEIYNQAFQDGYVKAEVDASISAYKEKDAAYRRGHSDGYFKGYQDAVKRFSQENNRNNRD